METFFRLKLVGSFLVAGTLSSKSKFEEFVGVVGLFADLLEGYFDDLLHVGALGADDPPGNLELFLILNLNVVPASQLVLLGCLGVAGRGRESTFVFVFLIRQEIVIPLHMFVVLAEEAVDLVVVLGGTPFDAQFGGHTSEVDAVEEFHGDEGIEEGLVENVADFLFIGDENLVQFAELLEN